MKKIVVIGMGTMGSAISELLQNRFTVVGIRRGDSLEAIRDADAVVLAVKPQQFAALADDIRDYIDSHMVVSIMAGVTLDQLRQRTGSKNVVRTMPNLGLAQGQSLTAWLPARSTETELVRSIIALWGASLRLQDETQFDAFTALVGSGPAYFFELARVLEAAARQYGFDAKQAQLIAKQTFLGAASVVDSETDFAAQVQRVASKGGTTEAAFGVLAAEGFADTIHHAVSAAKAQSRELSTK